MSVLQGVKACIRLACQRDASHCSTAWALHFSHALHEILVFSCCSCKG